MFRTASKRLLAGAAIVGAGAAAFTLKQKLAAQPITFAQIQDMEKVEKNVAFAAEQQVPHTGLPGTKFERTFIAIKPDGVQRGLTGEIINRFEKKGYQLVGIKILVPSQQLAETHYEDLKARPFFPGLVKYITSAPVIAMVFQGRDAVKTGRKLVGATNPLESAPGSIRGDFCIDIGRNIIHGSDSNESAKAEISLWFKPEEVVQGGRTIDTWIYESK